MSQILEHASWIYPSEDIGEICPVFRKHFTARPGAAAKLEITAFGVYEAFLNGQRIGNFFLAPGWTSYPTRLQVQTYDLTALLREENELTVTLGKGWFAGRISAGVYQAIADGPRLLAALHLTDADGTREYATDESWQWAESPIRFSDIYDGETYDARVTPENWHFCRTDSCGKQMLIPQEGEIVTEHERLKPVAVLHTPKGEWCSISDRRSRVTRNLPCRPVRVSAFCSPAQRCSTQTEISIRKTTAVQNPESSISAVAESRPAAHTTRFTASAICVWTKRRRVGRQRISRRSASIPICKEPAGFARPIRF